MKLKSKPWAICKQHNSKITPGYKSQLWLCQFPLLMKFSSFTLFIFFNFPKEISSMTLICTALCKLLLCLELNWWRKDTECLHFWFLDTFFILITICNKFLIKIREFTLLSIRSKDSKGGRQTVTVGKKKTLRFQNQLSSLYLRALTQKELASVLQTFWIMVLDFCFMKFQKTFNYNSEYLSSLLGKTITYTIFIFVNFCNHKNRQLSALSNDYN